MTKLFFINDSGSTLSQKVPDVLTNYKVKVISLDLTKKNYLKMVGIALIDILPSIVKSDISIIWSADYHTAFVVLLSKLFGKKSIVIVCGHEVCNMPEINYGYQLQKFRGWVVRWILRNVTSIIVPSYAYQKKVEDLVGIKPEVIFNSVDIDIPKNCEKEPYVVMVARQYMSSKDYISLKGIKTYCEIAYGFCDTDFYLIGDVDESIRKKYSFIKYLGEMSHESVLDVLSHAKVYCQLSYTESFGVSLLEALQCGCIPVVVNKDGMGEIVGKRGFSIDYGNWAAGIDCVLKALDLNDDRSKDISYYKEQYSKDNRRKKFEELIDRL